jgi:ring-1,2-phenylacetyl-CoA epoxidase subunit PaaE
VPLLPRHRAEAAAFQARRRGHPSVHELPVAAVARLAEDAVAITFAVPEGLRPFYRFRHGQHVTIVHGDPSGELRRSYSLCGPAGSGELRIGVRRVARGALSEHLATQVRAGDVLRVMTPTGGFTTELDPSRGRRYVAVAGGSGITPIMSMVATILEAEPQSAITLLYANRTRGSTMFLSELEALARRYRGRLAVRHYRSREPAGEDAGPGRLDRARWDELLAGDIEAGAVDVWLLCGPEALADAASAALLDHGVAAERIHRERFSAPAAPAPAGAPDRPLLTSEVVVRFDARSASVTLSSHGPAILSAALPALPDLPYSCSEGLCATCRAKVVEGAVEMDRCSGLDAGELREGWILTCQAHPVTERVVLDFDVP